MGARLIKLLGSVIASCALLGIALAARGATARASHLVVLYTSAISGELEPCGCTTGPLGGFVHRGPLIQWVVNAGSPTLMVDTGNLLLREGLVIGEASVNDLHRARLLMDLLESHGARAMAIGPQDVVAAGGISSLKALFRGRKLVGLSANLLTAGGDQVFPGSMRLGVGGLQIGLIGATGAGLDLPQVGADVHVGDAVEAVTREALALEGDVDLLIVLSNMDELSNEALAAAIPQLDFILSGARDNPTNSGAGLYDADGEPPFIVPLGPQGRFVGRLDVVFGDSARGARPVPAPELGSSLRKESLARETLADLEARIIQEEGAPNPARLEAQGALQRRQIEAAQGARAASRARPGFYYTAIPIAPGLSEDLAAKAAIDAFKLAEAKRQAEAAKASTPVVSFAGNASCRSCHPLQWAQWRGTDHARAYETLKRLGRQGDPQCIGCHTTGFKSPGGFHDPLDVAGFEGVGCESCHGPMSDHPARRKFVAPTSVATCTTCHDAANDPDFNHAAQKRSVTCPAGVTSPGGLVGETAGH